MLPEVESQEKILSFKPFPDPGATSLSSFLFVFSLFTPFEISNDVRTKPIKHMHVNISRVWDNTSF